MTFSAREEHEAVGDRLYQVVAARTTDDSMRTILTNATVADGRRVDVIIDDGRIAAFADAGALADAGAQRIDLAGALLVPGMVDGHIHLDKTLLGLTLPAAHRKGDTVAERIRCVKRSCAGSCAIRWKIGRSAI